MPSSSETLSRVGDCGKADEDVIAQYRPGFLLCGDFSTSRQCQALESERRKRTTFATRQAGVFHRQYSGSAFTFKCDGSLFASATEERHSKSMKSPVGVRFSRSLPKSVSALTSLAWSADGRLIASSQIEDARRRKLR